jgi:prepilin-type N-terminal cleavage/methylation domain-containing protein
VAPLNVANSGSRSVCCRTRPRARRGFTLLEMVLALTIIATLFGLLTAVWRQAGDWSGDAAAHQRALRLPRVLEMIRTQWSERRMTIGLERPDQTVVITPTQIEFVTAVPVLGRAPIVTAMYVIEPDPDARASEPRLRLVYEERGVTDVAMPQRSATADAQRAGARTQDTASRVPGVREELPSRTVLLRNCRELRWEWYDDGTATGKEEARLRREAEALAQQEAAEKGEGAGAQPDDAADLRARSSAPARRDKDDAVRWRPLTEELSSPPGAVRLVGEYEGDPFTCLLVVAVSRS